MNYFPPPAQWKKPRRCRPDLPCTCGSSREQTMPKVASKLSLSQSPTAWMQPRTWITLSSSRRWKKSGEKHDGFHWDVGVGGRCYFLRLLLLASQRSGTRSVWELISWTGSLSGIFLPKTCPWELRTICTEIPQLSAAIQSHSHPWRPQNQLLSYHQASKHNSGSAFPGADPERPRQSLQGLPKHVTSLPMLCEPEQHPEMPGKSDKNEFIHSSSNSHPWWGKSLPADNCLILGGLGKEKHISYVWRKKPVLPLYRASCIHTGC